MPFPLVAFFVLVGLSGLVHGGLALGRNVRHVRSPPAGRTRWLVAAFAAGVALAVGALFVGYPSGGSGWICGFPFPAGTSTPGAVGAILNRELPEVVYFAVRGFVHPLAYPMQLVNMVFAFLLPQLALRRWLRKGGTPPSLDSGVKSRHRFDAIFLVLTSILLVVYTPFITVAPRLLAGLPSWGSVLVEQAILIGPPAFALLGWCMASLWLFDGGLTTNGRLSWGLALTFAVLGFPAAFLYLIIGGWR